MMYANLRGANGEILGSVAIDPTAPGGMQGQLADAVQRMQQQPPGLPHAARPMQPGVLPPNAYQSMPVPQSRPFVCTLRYMTRAANGGVQWATRAITCPQGLPPGIYVHVPGGQ